MTLQRRRAIAHLALIASASIAVIASIFTVVLPELFPGYRSPWLALVIVGGVGAAAYFAGEVGYRSAGEGRGKYLLSFVCAIGVAAIVLYFSMFIILNIRGS